MNRRSLLASIAGTGATLAGCIGEIDYGGDPKNDRSNDMPTMTVSIDLVDEGPDSLTFDITLQEDALTGTSAPTFDIAVNNTGDETASWSQAGDDFAFPARTAGDTIAIGSETEIESGLMDADGCARVESGIGRDHVEVTTELEPGEELKQRYALAGRDDAIDNACPPTGIHRAEYEYGNHGTWGFELELTAA